MFSVERKDSVSTEMAASSWAQVYCVPYYSHIYTSRGVFYGDDPLKHLVPTFLFQLALAFSTSWLIYLFLRPFKQPRFVCNVLSGIIIGPSGLGRNKAILDKFFPIQQMSLLNTVSMIGVIYFIFITAVKMNPTALLRISRRAWVPSLACVVVPFTLTALLAYIFQDQLPGVIRSPFNILLATAIAVPHAPVIVHAVNELNLSTSDLGQLAMACSLLCEMLGSTMLGVGLIMERKSTANSYKSSAFLILLIILTIFVVRPAVIWIIKITPEGKPVKRIYVVGILLVALIMSILSDLGGASYMPGALLMGLIIPDGLPLGATIVEKSEFIIMEFLLPLFFVRIGYHTDVFAVQDWRAFGLLQLIVLICYVAKIFCTCMVSCFTNITLKNAFLLSLILNTTGLIDLIFFIRWKARKFLDGPSFSALVISNVTVTAIVTPLIQLLYQPHLRLKPSRSLRNSIRSLQATPNNGELRIICCVYDEDNVPGIITLLEASNPSEISPMCAYVVHTVELVGRGVPLSVPYELNTKKYRLNATDRIMTAFSNYSTSSIGPLTICPFKMIAPFKTMHVNICRLAEDQVIPLIIVPFHRNQELHGRPSQSRSFNTNMLSYAPSTVGILVDRSSLHNLTVMRFTFNVALVFLGGADDREALALAIRMSNRPNVSVTALRINFTGKRKEETKDYEIMLDNMWFSEFKAISTGNDCVACHQVDAEHCGQVIDAVRSLGNNYDLIMTGRGGGAKQQLEGELESWIEYRELGVIGDVIASPDFAGSMTTSVLVMQHCPNLSVDSDSMKILQCTEAQHFV